MRDEVKTSEGPPARSQGQEGPWTSCKSIFGYFIPFSTPCMKAVLRINEFWNLGPKIFQMWHLLNTLTVVRLRANLDHLCCILQNSFQSLSTLYDFMCQQSSAVPNCYIFVVDKISPFTQYYAIFCLSICAFEYLCSCVFRHLVSAVTLMVVGNGLWPYCCVWQYSPTSPNCSLV